MNMLADNDAIETRVRAVLNDLEIRDWEWISIDPQYGDTADFCAQYGYDLPHSANTIIVASKRGAAAYSACIVRASDRLDVNRRVRRLMGVSRASFASADETMELTGMMIGGVTALALPEGPPHIRLRAAAGDGLHHPGGGQPVGQGQDAAAGIVQATRSGVHRRVVPASTVINASGVTHRTYALEIIQSSIWLCWSTVAVQLAEDFGRELHIVLL